MFTAYAGVGGTELKKNPTIYILNRGEAPDLYIPI